MNLDDLSPRNRRIYDTLAQCSEGMTMAELFEYMHIGDEKPKGVVFERIDPSELRDLGLVVRSYGKRECSTSGRLAYFWRTVAADEAVAKPRRTAEQKLRELITAAEQAMLECRLDSPLACSVLATALGEARR